MRLHVRNEDMQPQKAAIHLWGIQEEKCNQDTQKQRTVWRCVVLLMTHECLPDL